MVYSLLDERKVAELKEDRQVDFSFGFPASAFTPMVSSARDLPLAFRVVPFHVPHARELGRQALSRPCSTSHPASCSLWGRPVRVSRPPLRRSSTAYDASPVHILTVEDRWILPTTAVADVQPREAGADVGWLTTPAQRLFHAPGVVLLGQSATSLDPDLAVASGAGPLVSATLHHDAPHRSTHRRRVPSDRRDQIQVVLAGPAGVISPVDASDGSRSHHCVRSDRRRRSHPRPRSRR